MAFRFYSLRSWLSALGLVVAVAQLTSCSLPDDPHCIRTREKYRSEAQRYMQQRQYAKASAYYTLAREEAKKIVRTHLYEAADLVDLASVEIAEGRAAEALPLLEKAREMFESVPDGSLKDQEDFRLPMSACYTTLWRAYEQSGKQAETFWLLSRAVDRYRVWLDQGATPDPLLSDDARDCLLALAQQNRNIGKNGEADALTAEADDIARKVENAGKKGPTLSAAAPDSQRAMPAPTTPAPTTSPDFMRGMDLDTEGMQLHAKQDYAGAGAKFKAAAADLEKCCNDASRASDRLQLALAYEHLADSFFVRNRMKDALVYYQKALTIKRSLNGNDKSVCLDYCLRQTGKTLINLQQYGPATEMFRYALDTIHELPGDHSAETMDSLTNLELCLNRQGLSAEAKSVGKQIEELQIQTPAR